MAFDKHKWAEVIKQCIGDRSMNEFARISGVNKASISYFVNEKQDKKPTYETVEKICNASPLVPEKEIFEAAGHPYRGSNESLPQIAKEIMSVLITEAGIDPNTELTDDEVEEYVALFKKCVEIKKMSK